MTTPDVHSTGLDEAPSARTGESADRRGRVLVSGGATGIGRAIARRFAEDGYAVTIVGRRRDVLERAAADLSVPTDNTVTAVPADVSDAAAVTELAEGVAEDDAGIAVVVNAAGGLARTGGDDVAAVAAAWEAHLRGNLLSAVLLTEAIRPHLTVGARVITIGSIAGSTGAGAYGAAKAALVAWNSTLAGQLATHRATANVIAPGYVTDTEFFGDTMTAERHDRLVGRTLLGRAGRPDDVAGAAAFLASDDAAWITGQVLHVNGGALRAR